MNITRTSKLGLAVVGLALLLSACGGGGGGDGGVASLAGSTDQTASSAPSANGQATEEQVLAWVQCVREQGVDIADPTVDADGNLVLGGGPGGRGGAAGATGTAGGPPPDRAAFTKATETCGNPPRTGGGFSAEDRQARQDSALQMAACLRDEGLDVADPDFSGQGPGGAPAGATTATTADNANRPRGLFGDLDMNDPKVSAAFTTCQAKVTTFQAGPPRASTATTGGSN
jgi:hypothetical protein